MKTKLLIVLTMISALVADGQIIYPNGGGYGGSTVTNLTAGYGINVNQTSNNAATISLTSGTITNNTTGTAALANGLTVSGMTNPFIYTLSSPPLTYYWTNSATAQFASQSIPESYFHTVARTPPMTWNSYVSWGPNTTETNILVTMTNFLNSPVRPFPTIVVDDGWYATNGNVSPIGSIYDTNGIIQVDTNKFPHGLAWLGNVLHTNGFKFGLFMQCGQYSDSGAPYQGVTNYYGNILYAITNYGVDYIRGHGDWGTDPFTSFIQQVQAQLACVVSESNVTYAAQDCWPDNTKGTHWFSYFLPWYGKFFSIVTQKSGSGYADNPTYLSDWRGLFNYSLKNFSSVVSEGHFWEDLGYNWNPVSLYDALWRWDKVAASGTAMCSASWNENYQHPENVLYQSVGWPLDVIKRIDQDPLCQLPKLVLQTGTSNTNEVWMKKLEGGRYALWTVNWDTNNPATVSYLLGSVGIPTNCTSYLVHDCWSNEPDWYLPVTTKLTNNLLAGDCSLYTLTPYTAQSYTYTIYPRDCVGVDGGPSTPLNSGQTPSPFYLNESIVEGAGFTINIPVDWWATNIVVTMKLQCTVPNLTYTNQITDYEWHDNTASSLPQGRGIATGCQITFPFSLTNNMNYVTFTNNFLSFYDPNVEKVCQLYWTAGPTNSAQIYFIKATVTECGLNYGPQTDKP